MRIELPVAEALAFVTADKPLPPLIESISGEGSHLEAVIDLQLVPSTSLAMSLLAAAAGTLTVTATFAGFARGVAAFDITAAARGLPVHKLLPALLDRANQAIRDSDIPDELIELTDASGEPQLLVTLQRYLAEKVPGITVTGLDLRDGVLHVEAGL